MSTTIIALVLLLAQNDNYTDIRLIDHFSSHEVCQAVIERFSMQEAKTPTEPQIAHRLACMTITYESKATQKETPVAAPNKPVELAAPVQNACPPRVVLGKTIKCLDA